MFIVVLFMLVKLGGSLGSRMGGHRSAIRGGGQGLHHRHFHRPDHSVDDMRVQILEKVYHSSESPALLASLRGTRELFWIRGLVQPGHMASMTKSKESVP